MEFTDPAPSEPPAPMQAVVGSREYSKTEWLMMFAVAMANTGLEVPIVGITTEVARRHFELFDITGMEAVQSSKALLIRQRPMFRR